MAVSLTHAFRSPKRDGSDATLIQPSDWNADHEIEMTGPSLIGRESGTGVATEIPLSANMTFVGGALATTLEANLSTESGASLVGVAGGGTVQSSVRYQQAADYELNLGYDHAEGIPAAVRIGGNSAFLGTEGLLQIGGAGPRDGGNGTYLVNDGHPNWLVPQTSIPFNPTEFNIYANGNGGVAVSTGTTTLTRSTGPEWGSFMVGRLLWFDGVAYTVNSATASSAVLNSAPPAATACWSFCYTTGSGTCTVASGVVTRTTGDPYIPHTFTTDTFEFWLNSTLYTVTASNGADSCTISSPPADGSYSYSYRCNINNQVSTWRLQLIAGASEENLTAFAAPYAYVMGAQTSGSGKRRAWYLTSEGQAVVEMAPVGKFVSLGGPQGNEAIRAGWTSSSVNRFDVLGAIAGQAPIISAGGTDTNIDIRLAPKGTGSVWLGGWTSNADAAVNGYITVKDSSGNVRKLATIA